MGTRPDMQTELQHTDAVSRPQGGGSKTPAQHTIAEVNTSCERGLGEAAQHGRWTECRSETEN